MMKTKLAALSVRLAAPFNSEEIERRVVSILRSRKLVQGETVLEFERALSEYIGCRYIVCLNSGTAALHSALLAIKIAWREKKKTQVVTTPLSFAATANAIIHAGCRPVFVDVDPNTFNIDPELVGGQIGEKTLAVEPVDVYGLPAELGKIKRVAGRSGVPVVEDAAESIGAHYHGKKIGMLCEATCFSTYATKNLHTAEGGFVATNSIALASSMRKIRNQGQASRYRQTSAGYNYRMLEFCAAIGLAQLPILDSLNAKRRENAMYLRERLSRFDSLRFQEVDRPEDHSWYLFSVLLDRKKAHMKRDLFVRRLRERGIEADVAWPTPIHLQPYFRDMFGYRKGRFPHAERVCEEVFQLPIHPFLTRDELDLIVSVTTDLLS